LHNTVPNKVSLRKLYELDNHRYIMENLLFYDTLKEPLNFYGQSQGHYLNTNVQHEHTKTPTLIS